MSKHWLKNIRPFICDFDDFPKKTIKTKANHQTIKKLTFSTTVRLLKTLCFLALHSSFCMNYINRNRNKKIYRKKKTNDFMKIWSVKQSSALLLLSVLSRMTSPSFNKAKCLKGEGDRSLRGAKIIREHVHVCKCVNEWIKTVEGWCRLSSEHV